jgi:hypothetical protein
MKRINMILTVILLASLSWAGQAILNGKAPDFALPDQRDHPVALKSLEGQVVALVASDKEGMKQNPAWRKAIGERYGERVKMQGIADLRKVPFFLKGSYKRDFQKDPDSIILDWKGEIFTTYGFAKDVSNIVVIDRKGIVQYMHSGAADPAVLEEAFRAIDRVLE